MTVIHVRAIFSGVIAEPVVALLCAGAPLPAAGITPFTPVDRALRMLNAVPTAASLGAWHELLGSEPHVAGTDGHRASAALEKSGRPDENFS